MPLEGPTRRRAIAILAATTAGSISGISRAAVAMEWRGLAMGTDACIVFSGAEPERVGAAIAATVAEIERLERSLSLFRSDSEICRLNQRRSLQFPTNDMRGALELALSIARATDGLFDPTVQALWEAHVDWFAAFPAAGLPPEGVIAAARSAVDWRRVVAAADLIRIGRDQRITLNGLGQGYVTDRIADLLRQHGFRHVLLDLGEQRALGPRAEGGSWEIARAGAPPLRLSSGALATSAGSGCILGAAGAAHHLFDPRTGRSARSWRRLTVHHRSAAVADALSTALYAASPAEIAALVARFPGVAVWGTDWGGREHRWSSGVIEGVSL